MTSWIEAAFSQGAEIRVEQLVALRKVAPLLPVYKQKKVVNDLSGRYRSSLRGRGMDYSEVRQYQAGDDLRSMDWRVTARTGMAHVKVFHEERERPVLVVCDLRANMFFGSKRALKSVVAGDVTSLLAWAAVEAGDRIGALIFNDQKEWDIRPKTGSKAVLKIIKELGQQQPTPAQNAEQRMEQICRHLRRVATPGSCIYFISDFLGFNAACQQQLFQVVRHSDIIALQITDPLEQELPPPGQYLISDGQQNYLVDSRQKNAREQYRAAFAKRQQELEQALHTLRIPCLGVSTQDSNLLDKLVLAL
ncbi:MAG: DUF58 domain-containing protein [Venatoribacter sp.]